MKKILSIFALCALAVNCFATGNEGVNPAQNGVISVVTNGGAASLYYTNTFPFAYQSLPVVTLFNLGNTNAVPFTNTVSTTNFIVELNTPTNTLVAWQSYMGTPTIQVGSFTNSGAVSQTVPFARPFAQLPTVILTPAVTNAGTAAVTGVTLTNFTVLENISTTNYYEAFGIAPIPAVDTLSTAPGYNHVNF
jgi:hypothetical protein